MSTIQNTNLIPPSPQIDINSLQPFTRFCCSIGAIPASYLVSMSYEEQLLWLCDYLENTVIPTVNNNGEAVAELQGLYTQLKNYIDNYFTNLDVQQEINNKLDEMAENGELEKLLLSFFNLNPYIIFKNNEELKNATFLKNKSIIKTLGFYAENDGGGNTFIISDVKDDSILSIELSNGLFANIVLLNNELFPEQIRS